MHKLLAAAVTAVMIVPLAASAAEHRKPGLWQLTIQTHFTKGGPQIPPEQRARMEQLGIKVPGLDDSPTTTQSCLTPEQAANDEHPEASHGRCQRQNPNWSGHTFGADLVCQGEGGAHGHMQFVGNGSPSTSYTGTAHLEGSNPHLGGDFAMDSQISGQWQGADCGAVKPFPQRQ